MRSWPLDAGLFSDARPALRAMPNGVDWWNARYRFGVGSVVRVVVVGLVLTIALPGQHDRAVLLEKAGPPSMSEETAAQVRELIAKGAAGGNIFFQTDDAYKTHAELKERGVEITEDPVDRGYGVDFGLRDPFGNHLRVAQMGPA